LKHLISQSIYFPSFSGKGAVVSPEIETAYSHGVPSFFPCGKGAVVSPEIETCMSYFCSCWIVAVARERWSRLRLKPGQFHLLSASQSRGKGAVVSPEIETHRKDFYGTLEQSGKGAVVSPEIETQWKKATGEALTVWQGSGGLA